MENAEVNNIIKIVGLKYKTKYETPEELKTLRYGKIMIMADQDQDGSHIKGLLVNFFHHNWPALLRSSFLEEFITPIVKVRTVVYFQYISVTEVISSFGYTVDRVSVDYITSVSSNDLCSQWRVSWTDCCINFL